MNNKLIINKKIMKKILQKYKIIKNNYQRQLVINNKKIKLINN